MTTRDRSAGTQLTEMHAARGRSSADFLLQHLSPGADLLDVGSGPGTITVELASLLDPGTVTGVDLDPGRVQAAEELAHRSGVSNVSFRVADAYRLPFEDDSFDAVFSHAVLVHLADPARAITEMMRVVKPGGLIGVSDPDHDGLIIEPATPDMVEHGQFVYDWKASRGGDYFIGKRLKALLREAGLRDLALTVSHKTYSTPEEVASFAHHGDLFCADPDVQAYAREIGLEDFAATVSRWQKAGEEWSKDPDALVVMLDVEVVGRKP